MKKKQATAAKQHRTWTCGCGKTHQESDRFCRWCYDLQPPASDERDGPR